MVYLCKQGFMTSLAKVVEVESMPGCLVSLFPALRIQVGSTEDCRRPRKIGIICPVISHQLIDCHHSPVIVISIKRLRVERAQNANHVLRRLAEASRSSDLFPRASRSGSSGELHDRAMCRERCCSLADRGITSLLKTLATRSSSRRGLLVTDVNQLFADKRSTVGCAENVSSLLSILLRTGRLPAVPRQVTPWQTFAVVIICSSARHQGHRASFQSRCRLPGRYSSREELLVTHNGGLRVRRMLAP